MLSTETPSRGILTFRSRSSHPAFPATTSLRSAAGDIQTTSVLPRSRSLTHVFEETAMAQMNGTIKRLVSDKGFGFILASDGNEYFFHNSACSDTRFDDLREGQAVTFDRGQGPKGPRGENVRVA